MTKNFIYEDTNNESKELTYIVQISNDGKYLFVTQTEDSTRGTDYVLFVIGNKSFLLSIAFTEYLTLVMNATTMFLKKDL